MSTGNFKKTKKFYTLKYKQKTLQSEGFIEHYGIF